ncbi:hypothetical protein [Algisphaera agarilytica]|uniref:Uncharacterized protein n=1 Tax=Algisphaera agarilytica TaxID=1385975 RepID=A0A7X0HAV5_9BACT|nr:hypothetical protein [Algisphaera agarilytica]MBB6431005.1 hypothetical protein [Algisphaera agarilytica]
MRLFAFAILSLSMICGTSSAGVTLLVDFGPFKTGDKNAGNQKKPQASTDDFALADPQVDPQAQVNNMLLNMAPARAKDNDTELEGVGIVAEVTFKRLVGYGAFGGDYGKTPILNSYLYVQKTSSSVTVSSLEEIEAGSTVTVAAWGGGDKPGQDTIFSITYDGVESSKQTVVHGVPQAEAFATFTFTKVDGVDEVTINYGNPDDYAGFSGFSITSKNETPVTEPE